MSVSEVREAVRSAVGAVGGKLGALFSCITLNDENGQVTVLCTEPDVGLLGLPRAVSFTIDLEQHSTYEAIRRVALDRLCEYLLNGPRRSVA